MCCCNVKTDSFGNSNFDEENSHEDLLYTLPNNISAEAEFDTVDSLLCGVAKRQSAIGSELPTTITSDETLDFATNESTAASQCPVSCFRVLHLNPFRAKLLKTPFDKIRSDHVAVAPYRINARSLDDESLAVSSTLSYDVTAPIKFLSLSVLLQISPESLVDNFLECKFKKDHLIYKFERHPLPPSIHEPEMVQFLTALFNAEAYPGPWQTYTLDPARDALLADRIDILLAERLLERPMAQRYQLTQLGYSHIAMQGTCSEFTKVLERKSGKAIEDYTTWEFIDKLCNEGWTAHPAPRGKLVAIPTTSDLDEHQRKLFFDPKRLTVVRPYLACIATRHLLAGRGMHCNKTSVTCLKK